MEINMIFIEGVVFRPKTKLVFN